MSRRKQANPAKLGETDTNSDNMYGEDIQVKEECVDISKLSDYKEDNQRIMEIFKIENNEANDEEDIDIKLKEGDKDELDDERDDYEDVGSILNGQGSSPSSSSEQESPVSSCQSSLSDATEVEDIFTMGATATTPYECNICKRAFARSSLLSKHVQTHTEQLQFSCPYCRRLFKHKRSRDRHTKLHTGDKKYKCLHCDSAFARSDHLKIHMKTHDHKKPHQCELCNRGYNTAAALASHQQHHSKQEQRRCESSASRTSAVSTPSPGNLRCMQCPDTFETSEHLQNHLVIAHQNITPPISQQSNLTIDPSINMPKSNNELPKIACMYCCKDFISMNHMYKHIHEEHRTIFNNISQNYNPVQSPGIEDLSPKECQQNNSPTYACDQCTIRFDSSILLQEHIQIVHYGQPEQNKYDFTKMSLNKTQANMSQAKPTDLSRKRCSENSTDYKTDKRKSGEQLANKQTSPSTGIPYESNDKPCICSYCYAQMPNFKMFLLHMETHVALNSSTPTLPLTTSNNIIGCCPLCGEPARNTIELSRHICGHAIVSVTARCCHYCKKPFDQIDQLQKHLLEAHSQTVYKCTICSEIFETQLTLQVHFSNKHSPECKHYRCNLCSGQVFHDRLTAELHVNMKHSIQEPLGSNSRSYYLLRFPEVESHLDFPVYQCPICQKAFKDEYLQYDHILKEHGDTREGENYILEVTTLGRHIPYGSPNFQYSKSISSSENLNKSDVKAGNKYSCEICNRTDITSEAELAAHKKLLHAKSKVSTVSLQCAYCNEHCKSRSDLENHMKSHQVTCGKGKHKCNICDEIFSSSGTLAEHKLSHCKIISGNSCTQCKTVLINEHSFYNHQLQHNNISAVNKSSSHISLPANCIICCQTLQTDVEIKLHAKFHLRHLLQNELICGICKKVCDDQQMSVKHIKENNSHVTVNICKDCILNSKETSFSPHIDANNDQKKIFACLKCTLTFESEEEVQNHATDHMINEESNLECHLCRNVLPSSTKLQIHLIEHNFMGMGQYRCYVCSSVFTTAIGLRSHIINHGLNHRPYECSECKMKYFFETELENHKYMHSQHNKYAKDETDYCENAKSQVECKGCLCIFPENTYYKEHIHNCRKIKFEDADESEAVDIKKERDDCEQQ